MRQGWRRYFHRNIWPETNVGAAVRRCDLPAMRRAGGARFPRRCNCVDVRLAAHRGVRAPSVTAINCRRTIRRFDRENSLVSWTKGYFSTGEMACADLIGESLGSQ
ncbi:hypothetical protein EI693_14635 [Pseudomonas oryziphila]|uniref:Uncharacterized protein n=1 Tax=Pseudomonas oryziphila TaxID=2894079 RepID=A0ABM7CS10_9PSED|nr:hypothetical protein EI693_14635 [Pseudomonas oryziphila]